MRGSDGMQEALFMVAKLEDFVASNHPLRPIHAPVHEALSRPNGLFNTICADTGRASIAAEKLLRALLIPVFFSGTTDPDARLFRKSHNTAAVMALQGQVSKESRSGLVVGAVVAHAHGMGERAAAPAMLDTVPGTHPKTLAADTAYDTRVGGSAMDGRTMRHPGYALSQTIRKRIEEHFGWGKTIGRIRQTLHSGIRRVDQQFKLTMTASNIVRMARMLAPAPQRAAQ